MSKRKKRKMKSAAISFLFLAILGVVVSYQKDTLHLFDKGINPVFESSYAMDSIPEYFGQPYIVLNQNVPSFLENENTTKTFEKYSELDSLNRCGVAFALLSKETMPTEERKSIGMIKPSGWHTVKYDIVDGKYLYNRCHLIGYQLASENANPKNLITCTREMNTGAMLEFENQVANYIKETENHVLYRVTPYFHDNDLVARGVQMEAKSIEDHGKGISFNIYVYNVQQGIHIDYKTGESFLENS